MATRGLELERRVATEGHPYKNMQASVSTQELVGNRYRIGMLVSLASIAMLFTSLSSAYIVRSGVTYDWYPMAVPRVLFGSTALLIPVSYTHLRAHETPEHLV